MRTIILIITNIRDLMNKFLPGRLARLITGSGTFAFIVHARDLDDVARKYPFARFMPKAMVQAWCRYQWPMVGSRIKGAKTKEGKDLRGWIIVCPLTTKLMLKDFELAKTRVLQAAKLAEKLGAKIIGLGAFTSIVTNDGKDLVGKLDAGITTGNAYAAAVALENCQEAAELLKLDLKDATAAVVGAAGSVGSACSKILSQKVKRTLLVDKNKDALYTLVEDLKKTGRDVQGSERINVIKDADIVIAVTNAPGAIVRASHLKPGAIVVDAAQPKNVSEHIPKQRSDVLVIESAISVAPGVDVNFDLGLKENEVLGCLAETIILASSGFYKDYSLGKVEPEKVKEISEMAESVGLRLAPFRNSVSFVSEADLRKIADIRNGS